MLYRISLMGYRSSLMLYRISLMLYRIDLILYRISLMVYRSSLMLYCISLMLYRIDLMLYRISLIIYRISLMLNPTSPRLNTVGSVQCVNLWGLIVFLLIWILFLVSWQWGYLKIFIQYPTLTSHFSPFTHNSCSGRCFCRRRSQQTWWTVDTWRIDGGMAPAVAPRWQEDSR